MSLPQPDETTTVLLTGASSGIGGELARELARRGHHLTIVARRRERLEALAAEIRAEFDVGVDVKPCDLGDAAARAQLISEIQHGTRMVIGVCNNAGFGTYGRFDGLDQAREREQIEVNVVAVHELCGAFVWPMVDRGAGAILNVASIAAYQPVPGMATYAATKAFVQSFSEALHAELAGTGVSCTTLSPGPVPTEWGDIAGVEDDLAPGVPAFAKVSARSVARAAVRGMIAGRRSVVPGAVPKVLAAGGRVAPRTVLLPAVKLVAGKRLARP